MTSLKTPQARACTLTSRDQQGNAAPTRIYTYFSKGMNK
jgi:hypothetical protein